MPPKKSAICQAFGQATREMRVERGFAQERFAAHAGLDRSFYGAIERGEFNCTLDTVMKIAGGLEVSASMLFARAKL
jgi:XRE family transcriptional regulator, regulator of sulfur utilization